MMVFYIDKDLYQKKGISDLDVIYIVEKMMKADPALKKMF